MSFTGLVRVVFYLSAMVNVVDLCCSIRRVLSVRHMNTPWVEFFTIIDIAMIYFTCFALTIVTVEICSTVNFAIDWSLMLGSVVI